jgi:O-antigen/teichoic acid export membrane protein
MFGKKKILGNLGWSISSKLSRQVLQLIVIFILSRILSPDEFGLMSMVTAFSMLAEIVRNMGMNAAVIQQKNENPVLLNTAFTFNLIVGLSVFLIFYCCAPLVSTFYSQPQLTGMVRAFAIVYIIGSLNIVQEALLQKRMEFKRLFLMDMVSVVISGIATIIMARGGWGVWSLIYQYILLVAISSLVLWLTSSWRPRIQFDTAVFKSVRKFSLNLFVHDIIYFFGRDTDKFIIGKYLGPLVLGIYSRAYMLMLLPVNQINIVVARVMFPVFSVLQDDIVKMKNLYLRSTNIISYVSFPALALLFIISEPLIIVLLGNKWVAVSFYLKIFCIYGMMESVNTTVYWIYKSLGRTDIMLRWGTVNTVFTIIAIIVGMRWNGGNGVAIAYVVIQLALLVPGWKMVFKLIDLDVSAMFRNIGPNFINAITSMFLPLMLFYKITSCNPVFVIVSVSFVYVIIYVCLSALFKHSGYVFITGMLNKRRFVKA